MQKQNDLGQEASGASNVPRQIKGSQVLDPAAPSTTRPPSSPSSMR